MFNRHVFNCSVRPFDNCRCVVGWPVFKLFVVAAELMKDCLAFFFEFPFPVFLLPVLAHHYFSHAVSSLRSYVCANPSLNRTGIMFRFHSTRLAPAG